MFLVRWCTTACILASMVVPVRGSPDSVNIGPVLLSGTLEFETAEMLKCRLSINNEQKYLTIKHVWFGHTMGKLHISAQPSASVNLLGGFEFRQYFNMFPPAYMQNQFFGDLQWHAFKLREAQGIFSLLKSKQMSLELAMGYMPYKYNPDVRNLGEFLFRSGTYPFCLLGEFDEPYARLTGLRLGFNYITDKVSIKGDGFALTEMEFQPYYDISLAAIIDVNFIKMLDIGGGVDFAHIISVNSCYTTPIEAQYLTDAGDTVNYTFKGTKLMAHATLDPLGMLRGDKGSLLRQIAGENGGKIYGEWAVIGLKNYPATPVAVPYGYDKLTQKMPWVVGINIPLWKILDVCSIELERFPSPYPNSDQAIPATTPYALPLPDLIGSHPVDPQNPGYDSTSYKFKRWYWSLYMKKQVLKNFCVICQMGRSHQRWEMNPAQSLNFDFEDAMVKPDQWGWWVKTVFSF